jgi:hypothetical protein
MNEQWESGRIAQASRLKRRRRWQALAAALVTFAVMLVLYNLEFSVAAGDPRQLEAEIHAYFFSDQVDAKILDSQEVGSTLLVFFSREGYPGLSGFAQLERGLLGKYRFCQAALTNEPLYSCTTFSAGGKTYLAVKSLYTLPDAATYTLWANEEAREPLYSGPAQEGPFLQLIPTEAAVEAADWSFWPCFRYYDSEGNELDARQLAAQLPAPVEGSCPSVSSAEQNLIYVLLAVIFLVGTSWVIRLRRL